MKTDPVKRDARRVVDCLNTYKPLNIFTFGNGGSASIAEHMACDWMKSADTGLRVISLSSNNSLLSAIGNDMGYENTCVAQLEWLAEDCDVVVLISSSGTSPNIVKAVEYCASKGIVCIGFSGFSGGPLRKDSYLSVHADAFDYGEVENYHHAVMHEVVRVLKARKK